MFIGVQHEGLFDDNFLMEKQEKISSVMNDQWMFY